MRARTLLVLMLMLVPAIPRSSGEQAAPAQAGASPSQVFPTVLEVVNVDVVVLDRRGNPIEGLTSADFAVKEDGRVQSVTSFEAVALAESPASASPRARVATNAGPVARGDRSFVVVFDDANLSQYATPRAQRTIVEFLTRGVRDGDQVTIVPTSGGAWWTGLIPEDRQDLIAFVRRLEGTWRPDTGPERIWDHEAIAIANDRDRQLLAQVARRYFENNIVPEAYPSADRVVAKELDVSPGLPLIRAKAREVYMRATTRLQATLATLERVAAALADLRGRKTLLLVSEGFIMDSSRTEFRDLIQAARNANAAVHFVDARGPGGLVGQPGMAGGGAEFGRDIAEQDTTTALAFAAREGEGARSIAYDTGGSVVTGTSLVDGMVKIAQESRSYYLLGYSSTNTKRDGKFRKIEVSLARPDVEVRARRGYYAPSGESERPRGTGQLDPAVRAGLDAPVGRPGIPLRLTSYVFGGQADGKVQVVLVAEANPAPLRLAPRAGRYEAKLDSYVVLNARDSGDVERQETLVELSVPEAAYPQLERSGVAIRREFSLAPGLYQARLLVRDRKSGLLGSVLHELEVPDPASFRASSLVLTDSFQPGGAGQPSLPVPIARRTFAPGARLACAFEVYGADPDATRGGPRVSVAYRLLRADGSEVGAAQPRTLRPGPLGQIAPVIVIALPADATGEHVLELELRDELSNASLDVSEPFVVARP